MSFVPVKDAADVVRKMNTMTRIEGPDTVESQVVVPADYPIVSSDILNVTEQVATAVERACSATFMMTANTLVGHNSIFEASLDSTNGVDGVWFAIQVARTNANTVETTTGVLAATPAYAWKTSVNCFAWVRVRNTAHTSGTATWKIQRSAVALESVPTAQTTGTQNVSLQGATNRAAFIGAAGIWFDDSSTVLAANATFTGASRDLTVTATATAMANASTYAKEVRYSAESDQSGTLWIEVSRDNTNWRRIKSVATAAVAGGGQYAEIIHSPSWRYVRGGFTNGATLQTRFALGSFLMAN